MHLKIAHDFGTTVGTHLILGMYIHYMRVHIFKADLSGSRSSFKVKGQFKVICVCLKIAHNFGTIVGTHLILGVHIHQLRGHTFRGELKSSFKVKGEGRLSKSKSKFAK